MALMFFIMFVLFMISYYRLNLQNKVTNDNSYNHKLRIL